MRTYANQKMASSRANLQKRVTCLNLWGGFSIFPGQTPRLHKTLPFRDNHDFCEVGAFFSPARKKIEESLPPGFSKVPHFMNWPSNLKSAIFVCF